jgi:hypothetical protein
MCHYTKFGMASITFDQVILHLLNEEVVRW